MQFLGRSRCHRSISRIGHIHDAYLILNLRLNIFTLAFSTVSFIFTFATTRLITIARFLIAVIEWFDF